MEKRLMYCSICSERIFKEDNNTCPREYAHDWKCDFCGTLTFDDRCECWEYYDLEEDEYAYWPEI